MMYAVTPLDVDHKTMTKRRYDKSLASRQAEVDLITADLDRAQSLIASIERENETLRTRLKDNNQGSRSLLFIFL